MKRYRTIVADPPWQMKIGLKRTMGVRGGWNKPEYMEIKPLQYPQMAVDEIAALQVPAEHDAHCYIWTINKYVRETYDIMEAWGFKPVTLLVWAKAPMGLGLGGTFCNSSEFILFGRRGKLRATGRIDRTWWQWRRGKHSVKPEEFQNIVQQVSPGPYLELFARREREGWDAWGNEVESDESITKALTGQAG